MSFYAPHYVIELLPLIPVLAAIGIATWWVLLSGQERWRSLLLPGLGLALAVTLVQAVLRCLFLTDALVGSGIGGSLFPLLECLHTAAEAVALVVLAGGLALAVRRR